MVCLSHKRTIALVDRLSEDHDVDVLFWAEDLKNYIQVLLCSVSSCIPARKLRPRDFYKSGVSPS